MLCLNSRDAQPIYEQVRDGLRHLVVTGAIVPGEKLPSVRALAASLSINPNTIQRAYDALEREGYLQAEAGKGCFALCPADRAGPRRELLLRHLDNTVVELKFLGCTADELCRRIKEVRQ